MRISDWSSVVCSSDLGLRIHRITADVGSLAIIRGLGGFLIAPCRHQQGGKRKSEAFYAEHDCASTAHARFEGQRRGKWHSLSIPPSFSVGCQTFNRVFLTKIGRASCRERVCQYV